MKAFRWVTVLVAVALIAADEPEKDELAKFQGTWVPESIQIGPKKTPEDSLKSIRLVVKGEDWTITTPGAKKYKLKIDPSKSPKHLDLIDEIGGKERVTPCLYEFKDDKLVVCRPYMQLAAKRPEKIEPDGEFIGVTVWKREKKK